MILCCGEALIDMLPRTSKAGEPAFSPYVWRSGVQHGDRARPPRRAGTEFFTGLSTDMFGEQIRVTLAESQQCRHRGYASLFSDRPTTLAFVTLKDGHATYTLLRREHRRRMLAEATTCRSSATTSTPCCSARSA
jgi:fructokinase